LLADLHPSGRGSGHLSADGGTSAAFLGAWTA
jgi:hypothetical protein